MSQRERITSEYFAWLVNLVCEKRFADEISFNKLLTHLHNIPFIYVLPRDEDRAEDGIDLRYRFACEWSDTVNAEYYIEGPCSILEMMVALSIRCEDDIMDDPSVGNRVSEWFWGMIRSLGLGALTDDQYDRRYVDDILERFINREYEPNGKGGLFTIKNCEDDLRDVEIWHQMCWYLNTITR